MSLIGSLAWQRPLALVALVLPFVVLLLALRREQPAATPTGTFHLWRGLGEQALGGRTSRRIPPARWLLALALALGTLALAGPRRSVDEDEPVWRIVVDRSPSMYLAHGAGTRLDGALALVERWRAESGLRDVELQWQSGDELQRARDLPRGWETAPLRARRAPRWELFDRPGTLFVTDAVPSPEPAHAGFAAGGGDAVPGPIASVGGELLAWDGEAWDTTAPADARALVLRGALPEPLARMARAWAAERGLPVVEEDVVPDAPAAEEAAHALVIEGPAAGASAGPWARASAGSWSLRARPPRARREGPAALQPWLAAQGSDGARVWVAWRAGYIGIDLVACEEPAGDPAAFAVAWSDLFDGAVLPATGVVDARERAAAGDGKLRSPTQPEQTTIPPGIPLVTWLAGGAALAALLAALISSPGRRL